MAKEYKMNIPAHPSIYEPSPRELLYNFYEPSAGINSDTGLLLIVQGYNGESYDSDNCRLYNMTLADKYNMITIQANYFGYEFMQSTKSAKVFKKDRFSNQYLNDTNFQGLYNSNGLDTLKLIELSKKCIEATDLLGYEYMNESLSYFNDMGIMQALDNLNAVLTTIEILKENGYTINYGKIITYGESHGAYLCYLCNRFAPHLFSAIIDNSAWLYPNYLIQNRLLTYQIEKLTYHIHFDYLAAKIPNDYELLHLPHLYTNFNNNCNIMAFHGVNDSICSSTDKENFCKMLSLCNYKIISEKDIDGVIFNSSSHCFDTNVVNLFRHVIDGNYLHFSNCTELNLPSFDLQTKQYTYSFDYSTGVPVLSRLPK